MTETALRVPPHPADSVAAERLWDALYQARAGRSRRLVADLEDAAFRRYLPLSRTLAHSAAGDATGPDRTNIEQAAELGLAKAVLAWGARTGAGFPQGRPPTDGIGPPGPDKAHPTDVPRQRNPPGAVVLVALFRSWHHRPRRRRTEPEQDPGLREPSHRPHGPARISAVPPGAIGAVAKAHAAAGSPAGGRRPRGRLPVQPLLGRGVRPPHLADLVEPLHDLRQGHHRHLLHLVASLGGQARVLTIESPAAAEP